MRLSLQHECLGLYCSEGVVIYRWQTKQEGVLHVEKKVVTLGEGAILHSELSNDQNIFVGAVHNGIEIFDASC